MSFVGFLSQSPADTLTRAIGDLIWMITSFLLSHTNAGNMQTPLFARLLYRVTLTAISQNLEENNKSTTNRVYPIKHPHHEILAIKKSERAQLDLGSLTHHHLPSTAVMRCCPPSGSIPTIGWTLGWSNEPSRCTGRLCNSTSTAS